MSPDFYLKVKDVQEAIEQHGLDRDAAKAMFSVAFNEWIDVVYNALLDKEMAMENSKLERIDLKGMFSEHIIGHVGSPVFLFDSTEKKVAEEADYPHLDRCVPLAISVKRFRSLDEVHKYIQSVHRLVVQECIKENENSFVLRSCETEK